ncbi:hypothetical protein [Nocardia sp. NPDC057030]|uniref:hypothetical protein n=1 Tax=unclassified Nocardia TaxID=2637762 RepID=UPI0036450992
MVTTALPELAGQFVITHTVDRPSGYTQLCITVRGGNAPIVIVDGVHGDVHVGVYEHRDDPPVRIDRNGMPL